MNEMQDGEPAQSGNPIRVQLTRWDLVAFNLSVTPRLRVTWVVWTLIALVMTTVQLAVGSADWVAAGIVSALGATVASLFGFAVSLVLVLVTANSANGVLGEHVYTFQADGLREQTSANDTVVKWGGASAMRRTGSFILISVAPALFYVLPRRHFASAAEYDAFWALAQRLKAG